MNLEAVKDMVLCLGSRRNTWGLGFRSLKFEVITQKAAMILTTLYIRQCGSLCVKLQIVDPEGETADSGRVSFRLLRATAPACHLSTAWPSVFFHGAFLRRRRCNWQREGSLKPSNPNCCKPRARPSMIISWTRVAQA